MELLTFKDGEHGPRSECTGNRPCPFRQVRFGGVGEASTGVCDEVSQDIVSQLLTDSGIESSSTSSISCAFRGISGCMIRRDAATLYSSLGKVRPLDFALVHCQDGRESMTDVDNKHVKKIARSSLVLGMKGPAHPQWSHPPYMRCKPLTWTSILKDIASHAQPHLTHLTMLIASRTAAKIFPEWLVLFGVVYDTEYIRIIAHMPYRKEQHVLCFASYLVDELPFRSLTQGTASCQLILERLRVVLALTTLRRHIVRLSKSLFNDVGLSWDGGGRSDDSLSRSERSACNSWLGSSRAESHSDSLPFADEDHASEQCSTEYSTCPSSAHANTDLCPPANPSPIEEAPNIADKHSVLTGASDSRGVRGDDPSLGLPSIISFCSTCSSSSVNFSASDSVYSEHSQCTESQGGDYMEPWTTDLLQDPARPNELTEARRCEIVAWARQVMPTEHPVDDTYRMTIRHSYKQRLGFGHYS
ncbi:hypothetical protein PAXRUDRAFT_821162 [Paxillus rubicundulus Ve08.2h10]|uniref:Uncharacterized protein n=1 Tax=Paxillus rubicundulus Ve08.2h10 TaxID=930991 RepID=A0A0D0E720_9AGAM|nr:hypothetical protein PAXRUDRAFT_821162 [Paxillus rubicundulus Ve08.2h10]